jgi:hypothetical protein
MDELLDRNSQGTITIAEKSRLETLVAEAEQLMVENGRRLAEFASRDVASVPVDAVPVTVWVKPAQVEDRQWREPRRIGDLLSRVPVVRVNTAAC